jgi:hypothetical protein
MEVLGYFASSALATTASATQWLRGCAFSRTPLMALGCGGVAAIKRCGTGGFNVRMHSRSLQHAKKFNPKATFALILETNGMESSISRYFWSRLAAVLNIPASPIKTFCAAAVLDSSRLSFPLLDSDSRPQDTKDSLLVVVRAVRCTLRALCSATSDFSSFALAQAHRAL